MVLPADFPQLTVPEQLFVAVDRERVDRGLAPFTGLTTALDAGAQKGRRRGAPPATARPGLWRGDDRVDRRRRQRARCRLPVDVQRRPGQWRAGLFGAQDARAAGPTGSIVLARFGSRHLVMGAAFDPNGDTSSEDRGGSSLAATLATASHGGARRLHLEAGAGRHVRRDGCGRCARSRPRSPNTGIGDPGHNVTPVPDYTRVCVGGGVDNSPACVGAVLRAINHAHALEGIRPMVLPAGFAGLEHSPNSSSWPSTSSGWTAGCRPSPA